VLLLATLDGSVDGGFRFGLTVGEQHQVVLWRRTLSQRTEANRGWPSRTRILSSLDLGYGLVLRLCLVPITRIVLLNVV
jgi:hypothetical protein